MRRTGRARNAPAVANPARAMPTRFVWTHVRQALQQAVTIGDCSATRFAKGSIFIWVRSNITLECSARSDQTLLAVLEEHMRIGIERHGLACVSELRREVGNRNTLTDLERRVAV